jgi:hypothetical protein
MFQICQNDNSGFARPAGGALATADALEAAGAAAAGGMPLVSHYYNSRIEYVCGRTRCMNTYALRWQRAAAG